MKKALLLIFLSVMMISINANDLTKVGIIRINDIYTRWLKESADARRFDELNRTIQEEISKRKIEIDQIDKELIEARDDDKQDLISELESELQLKKINLQQYTIYKKREINALISSDATKSDFSEKLQVAIKKVGSQNGYSVILNKADSNLVWYQPDVDITDLVIQSLMNN